MYVGNLNTIPIRVILINLYLQHTIIITYLNTYSANRW
jgi:hypothetical protein